MDNKNFIEFLKKQNIDYEIEENGLICLKSNIEESGELSDFLDKTSVNIPTIFDQDEQKIGKQIKLIIDEYEVFEFPDVKFMEEVIIINKSAREITFNDITINSSNRQRLTIDPNKIVEKIKFNKKAKFKALNITNNKELKTIETPYLEHKITKILMGGTKIKQVIGFENNLLFINAANSELMKYDNNKKLIGIVLDGTKKFKEIICTNQLIEIQANNSTVKKIIGQESLKFLYASNSDLEKITAPNLEICYVANSKISVEEILKLKKLKKLDIENIKDFEINNELAEKIKYDLVTLNVSKNDRIDFTDSTGLVNAFILKKDVGQNLFLNKEKINAFDDYKLDQKKCDIESFHKELIIIDMETLLDNYLKARGATEAQKEIFWGEEDSILKRTPQEINKKDKLYNDSITEYCLDEQSIKLVIKMGLEVTKEQINKIQNIDMRAACEAFLLKKNINIKINNL